MFEVKDMTVSYPDGSKAVKGMSFRLKDGESAVLIGANGAGKTSLFLGIMGVLPHGGEVRLGDLVQDKKTLEAFRQKAGLVFQNPDDMLFMPRIYDDIAFSLRNYGEPEDVVREKVNAIAEKLGITELLGRSSVKLSGGEKRMAALAAILVSEPEFILFDEPTAFLDPKARRRLIETLKTIDCTKLIATHDLSFAEEAARRGIFIRKGELFDDGKLDKLLYDEKRMDECGIEALGI